MFFCKRLLYFWDVLFTLLFLTITFLLLFFFTRPAKLSGDDGFDLETLDEAEVEDAVRALQRRGSSLNSSSLGCCRSPMAPHLETPPPGLLFPLRSPATPPADIHTPGSPTMPVLDAVPSARNAFSAQELPSCPHRLSPPPNLYAFPPVLSPQIYSLSENVGNHFLYSDPPVLSPQHCVSDEPISPPPFDPSPPALEEETGSVAGSREEAEFRCSISFLRGNGKRMRPSSPELSWSKRYKNPNEVGAHRSSTPDDSSSLDGDNASLCRQSRDVSFEIPRLVPCAAPQHASPSRDCPPSVSHSTSLSVESALIPDLHRISSPSSDSDWDSGLLSRLGPASAKPPALPDAMAQEVDTDLLHLPCSFVQDSGYESRLHTVLQPQAAGVRVGTGPLFGEDVDPSAFSRTLVKIVEVTH